MKKLFIPEEKIEIELSTNTVIELPIKLVYKKIDNYTLIIAPEIANWIVLFNENQNKLFKLIKNRLTIDEIFNSIVNDNDSENDFNFLISQIFDRKFFFNSKLVFDYTRNESMYIYLTNNCNLFCNHCYMYSRKPNINELPKEEWFKIINNFKKNNGKSITFTGGEILKYKDWFEVIKYTKNLNMTTTILTNGTLWNKNLIKKLKNFIDEVQISIDGTSEETNSIIRGKGNFIKAMNTAQCFANNDVKTTIATTPTLDNLDLIADNYVAFAKDIIKNTNNKNIYFKIAKKLLNGRNIKSLIKDKEKASYYLNITDKLSNDLYNDYSIKDFINNTSNGNGVKNCGYGGLSLSSNGYFFLCNRILELKNIGSFKDNFSDIMKKADYFYNYSSVDNTYICKDCELKYICGGGCRIDEFEFAGIQDKINTNLLLKKSYCSEYFKLTLYNKMIKSTKFVYDIACNDIK